MQLLVLGTFVNIRVMCLCFEIGPIWKLAHFFQKFKFKFWRELTWDSWEFYYVIPSAAEGKDDMEKGKKGEGVKTGN